jgi:hypothetical protein
VVEPGHQLAVRGPRGREFVIMFFQSQPQVGGLLFEMGDFLAEGIDVGGRAEPGFAPRLFAERIGQPLLELPDAGAEPDGAFVGGEQVSLQGCAGDGEAGGVSRGRRGGFGRVDLLQQVAVPVEEGAVDALLTELCLEFQQFSG